MKFLIFITVASFGATLIGLVVYKILSRNLEWSMIATDED